MVAQIPISIIICSAMGIPLTAAAATVIAAPDSFTLVGAALAAFCVVAYIRMKQPAASVWALIFNIVATGSVGWMLPETLAHYVLRLTELSNKTWTGLAFVCGLGGGAFVTAALIVLNRRVPKAVDRMADKLHLGRDSDDPPTEKMHGDNGVKYARGKDNDGKDKIKWCRAWGGEEGRRGEGRVEK